MAQSVEKLCEDQRLQLTGDTDTTLWKQSEGQYKAVFKTKQTWEFIRKEDQQVQWWRGVWFKHHIPKHAFLHWLAIKNRLETRDRMMTWNVGANPTCVCLSECDRNESSSLFRMQILSRSLV